MTKLTDKERFYKLIPEDGTPKGNGTIRAELGWSDEKYRTVRGELLAEAKIALGKGKGGSLYRVADIVSEHGLEKAQGEKYPDEESLYDDVMKYIRDRLTDDWGVRDFVAQKTAHSNKKAGGGIWTRPDFTLVTLQSFPYVPGRTMEVTTFEVKHYTGFNVPGVFEAAAHNRFAHNSYLTVYMPQATRKTLKTDDLERIFSECKRFGVGLLFFADPTQFDTYELELEPERQTPDPAEINVFIQQVLSAENKTALLSLFNR